jgi:pimeloyl-ACP methyl ester carboxylesterase
MKAITIDSNWRNDAINHRFIETNGIKMHIAEQGRGELLILCHGFPECWYAWRHQISAIAEAGFHVVAPDLRGYGQTDQPQSVEAYNILELTSDIVGLVHALDREQAAIVGHDQGASLAWHCGLLRPDLFKAIALLSVPYRRYINPTQTRSIPIKAIQWRVEFRLFPVSTW